MLLRTLIDDPITLESSIGVAALTFIPNHYLAIKNQIFLQTKSEAFKNRSDFSLPSKLISRYDVKRNLVNFNIVLSLMCTFHIITDSILYKSAYK